MITWNCGVKKDADADVANGANDGRIDQLAAVLKQFQLPVFLRWFPDANADTNTTCLGSHGAAGYVAAYQHIHDRLTTKDGVTNATFVWSVDTTTPPAGTAWTAWYPGDAYVDWVGLDGYATPSTPNVSDDFRNWYNTVSPKSRSSRS